MAGEGNSNLVKLKCSWVKKRYRGSGHLFLSEGWGDPATSFITTWISRGDWNDQLCPHSNSFSVCSCCPSLAVFFPDTLTTPSGSFSSPPGFCLSIPLQSPLRTVCVLFEGVFQVKL